MKKYVSVLMLLLVAFMFFNCDNGGGGEKKTVVTLTDLSVEVGGTSAITATTNPAGKTLTWTSSAPGVATVSDGSVTGVSLGTATITATAEDGEKGTCTVRVVTIKLDLTPPTTLPSITFNADWPKTPAASSFSNGAVTFTYNRNRQIAIIPLSAAQVTKLDNSQELKDEGGVTIRINAEVTLGTKPAGYEYFTLDSAGFRTHLADVSVAAGTTPTWNATSGGDAGQDPLTDQKVKYRSLDHAYDVQDLGRSNFRHFIIQAMFKNADGTTGFIDADTEFPEVKVTIKSITIEIGDTRTAAEKPPEE